MPRCFFFYGTLLAGSGNGVAAAVHARLGPGRAATVAGRLFAIPDPLGWYPALVAGPGIVHGQAYAVGPGFGVGDLALIDGYEACYPDDPAASDYLRREVLAVLADGTGLAAEAYVYARELPVGSLAVDGGDFAAFLARNGLRAFAPEG